MTFRFDADDRVREAIGVGWHGTAPYTPHDAAPSALARSLDAFL